MNRQKLIARYMLNNYPLKVAKKNKFFDKKTSFVGCTTNKKSQDINDVEEAKKAAEFIKNNELAFLLAVQFDLNKPVWKAWRAPYLIANSIKPENFNSEFLSFMKSKKLVEILKYNKLGCINLSHQKAADNIIKLCNIINEKYNGKVFSIWDSARSFMELEENISGLPGFGVGLTNMLIRDLITNGMIPQIRKSADQMKLLQVKPDVHIKRVFYRTGIAEIESERAALSAAKKYHEKCPAALDFAGFIIGVDYCADLKCEDCPLAFKLGTKQKLCPRNGCD